MLLSALLGRAQGCLHFDGVDDNVTINGNAFSAVGNGDFTLEAVVRGVAADQVNHGRILSNTSGFGDGFLFFFHELWGGSTAKMLGIQLGGNNYILIDNGSWGGEVLDGECHHVAIARENDSLHYYVDGSHIGDRGIFGGDPTVTTANPVMSIGRDESGSSAFEGNISQVRIFNFTRTAAQILADKDYILAIGTPGLIGYWVLNEGGGQVVEDRAGSADGVLGASTAIEGTDPAWNNDCCEAIGTIGMAEWNTASTLIQTYDPATASLQVAMHDLTGVLSVRITDALGRVVLDRSEQAGTGVQLDLADLPAGAYVSEARTGAVVRTLRFVKGR